MANLEAYLGDPLLRLLDDALLRQAAQEPVRNYLGGSAVGDSCARRQWYKLQGHKEKFEASTLRKFQDGHDTEAKIISWLRLLPGIELYTSDGETQYGFSDLDGKYKGHYDGIIKGIPQSPNTWHILEIKCVAEKKFKQAQKLITEFGEKNALQKWDDRYYAQALTYCWYEKLDRHITIIATPGGRELMTMRTNANHTFAKALRDRAQRIITAQEPPERIGGRDWWECRACSFKEICHG